MKLSPRFGCKLDGLGVVLNKMCLNMLAGCYVVSNAKIKLAKGLNKMPVSAPKGMMKTREGFFVPS